MEAHVQFPQDFGLAAWNSGVFARNSTETFCVSAKFPHQEIKWNNSIYYIHYSEIHDIDIIILLKSKETKKLYFRKLIEFLYFKLLLLLMYYLFDVVYVNINKV